MSAELFTPEGYSPALADLKLGALPVNEQLLAVHEVLATCEIEKLSQSIQSRIDYFRQDKAGIGVYVPKPTHNAFLLGQADPHDYYSARIWLHDYTDGIAPCQRREFTMLPHNHRDGLVALLLRNGYVATEERFAGKVPETVIIDQEIDWKAQRAELQPQDGHYFAGDIMSIHPDEVHNLERVAAQTSSLVVRLPAQRDFSVVFDGTPQIKVGMMTQYDHLVEELNTII